MSRALNMRKAMDAVRAIVNRHDEGLIADYEALSKVIDEVTKPEVLLIVRKHMLEEAISAHDLSHPDNRV